jgi:hypothetical protein
MAGFDVYSGLIFSDQYLVIRLIIFHNILRVILTAEDGFGIWQVSMSILDF